MKRAVWAWVTIIVCFSTVVAFSQISTEEAYKRLQERQAQHRQTATAPTTRPSNGPPESKDDWKEYRDAARGFTIKLPPDWQRMDMPAGAPGALFVAHPGGSTHRLKLLTINAQPSAAPEHDLKWETKGFVTGFRDTNGGGTLLDQTDAKLDGRPAEVVTTEEKIAKIACKSKHWITTAGDSTYILSFNFDAATFDQVQAEVQKIVDSFKVDEDVVSGKRKLTPAKVPSAAGERMVAYSDPKLGITLKYPASWKQVAGSNSHVAVGFVRAPAGPNDVSHEEISISIEPLDAIPTLGQLDSQLKDGYPKEIKDFKLISDKQTSLSGSPALTLVYTGIVPGEKNEIHITQVFAVIGKKLCMISCRAAPDRAAEFDATFATVLGSFKLAEPAK